jgi:hypothetical protein
VADDSGLLSDGKADSTERGRVDFKDRHHEPTPAVRLLVGYSKALDFIAAKPSIMFIQHCSVHPEATGPCFIVPRVNRMAALLAETHVAARMDTLIRRKRRFRALDPQEASQLDLDRLQDFRGSLSPVRWRTLALLVILVTLAIAFPVAVIADTLGRLAPKVILCSPTFSLRSFVENIGSSNQAQFSCSNPKAGGSLTGPLLSLAQVSLNPGSVINTLLSIRKNSPTVLLLLTIVMILSLCIALLVFRSGFRLKRLAFSDPPETPTGQRARPDHESLVRSGISSGGVYELERRAFAAVGLRLPWEFPLDLVVSAGLLALPLAIAGNLLNWATTPELDRRTTMELAVVAAGLIVAVILRMWWLVRIWRSRIRPKGTNAQDQSAPNGATLADRSSVYGAVLLATGCAVWDIMFVGVPGEPALVFLLCLLWICPCLAWSLSLPWWYGLHREFKAYGRLRGRRTFRAPALCIVPLLSTAIAAVMCFLGVTLGNNLNEQFVNSGFYIMPFIALFAIGFLGTPVGIYRLGWKLKRLRCPDVSHPVWRANAAGLAATGMYLLPPIAFLYFQSSFNRIWAESAMTAPIQNASAESRTDADAVTDSNNCQPVVQGNGKVVN